jgi:predicted nucleotidyltransferase
MESDFLHTIQSISGRYAIDSLYVFGSRAKEVADYARGKGAIANKKNVDIDIGVLPTKNCRLSVRKRVRLIADLEDLLGVSRVDLVCLSDVSSFLALEVIRGEQLYSGNPDRSAEYELYILRKAGDLAHFERQRRKQILAGAPS